MPRRAHARAVAVVAGASILVGALAGVGWGLIAPGQHLFVADAQHVLSMDLDSNNVFVGIAIFVLASALAGVLCGAGAWAWRSARGPAMGLGVMAGGLVGAWLAAQIGDRVASARFSWPGDGALGDLVGQVVIRPPVINIWVALIGQALAAGLVYLFAAGLTAESDLGVTPAGGAPRTRPSPAASSL